MIRAGKRSGRTQPLVFVTGPFPPPVHGMAVATERLARLLGGRFSVRRFDIAARGRSGIPVLDVPGRMFRAARVLLAFAWQLLWWRPQVLVVALSAGHAKAFDLLCVALGLAARRSVYLTHHSFEVFNGRRHRRLLRLARPLLRRCHHLVLCEDMKSQLCTAWTLQPAAVSVLSNAALLDDPADSGAPGPDAGSRAFRLGFIANLSAEKGLWTFLDVVGRLQAAGHPVHASIAGPVEPGNAGLRRALEQRLRGMQDVAWLGALHGDARTAFYRQLDLLLFPTTYRHESEPLVILEALAEGVPVIATRRGCIATALADGLAVRALEECDFAASAVEAIKADLRVGLPGRCERRAAAHRHYRALRDAGRRQAETLMATLRAAGDRSQLLIRRGPGSSRRSWPS